MERYTVSVRGKKRNQSTGNCITSIWINNEKCFDPMSALADIKNKGFFVSDKIMITDNLSKILKDSKKYLKTRENE